MDQVMSRDASADHHTEDDLPSTNLELTTRPTTSSIYRDTRGRGSTLSDSSAAWECFGKSFNKQETVGRVALFVIFVTMLSYLIYLSVEYFDTSINRTEYTKQSIVDSMPMPYIYFQFDTSDHPDNFSCNYVLYDKVDMMINSFNYYSSVNATIIEYLSYDSTFDDIANIEMSNLLDLNKWVIIHKFNQDIVEILIIPPSDATLDVSNAKNYYESIQNGEYNSDALNDVGLRLYACCGFYVANDTTESGFNDSSVDDTDNTTNLYKYYDISTEAIYSTFLWYNIDHLDQLKKYFYDSTINDTFNTLSITYNFVLGGYMAIWEYQWFDFENKINSKDEDTQYYSLSVGSTFDIVNVKLNQYIDYGYYDAFFLIIKPNSAGIKVTYYTTNKISWTDVFSDLGGMYGVVSGMVNFILIYLIWGVKFKNYYFPGLVGEQAAQPEEIEAMKIKAVFKHEIRAFKNEIKNLKQSIETLKQNGNNLDATTHVD